MSNEKQPLTFDDFNFMSSNQLTKCVIRKNKTGDECITLEAFFTLNNLSGDTETGIITRGNTVTEVFTKLHKWYNEYYTPMTLLNKTALKNV